MTEFRNKTRYASPVLCRADGTVLGTLPTKKLSVPWMQEIGELVDRIRANDGIEVTVLRLLQVDERSDDEFVVTYLAEAESAQEEARLGKWPGVLNDHPLRQDYAKPGGPAKLIDWAVSTLAAHGYTAIARPRQIRTWNLSTIWGLQTDAGPFWLKAVPPFFGHEGRVLRLFEGERVPRLLDSRGNWLLLYDIPGTDRYDASLEQMKQMIETLVDLQWRWHDNVPKLLDLGLNDWRSERLVEFCRGVIDRCRHLLTPGEQQALGDLHAALPEHMRALERCGMPHTLVHGDYHPGNWRGEGDDLYILDWGDCGVGQPLLETPPPPHVLPADQMAELERHWMNCWRERIPQADVDSAFRLTRPLVTLRMAATFQMFLDNIEPSERIYHDSDPLHFLQRTAAAIA